MRGFGWFLLLLLVPMWARAQTGVLVVHATPAVTSVDIDSVMVGTTPLTLEVAAGDRHLRVARAGFAPQTSVVRIPAGDTLVVRIRLSRFAGTLDVRGLPPGAQVFARDSLYTGGPLPTGEVPISIDVPGQRRLQRYVPVRPAETTVVEYQPRVFDGSVIARSLAAPGIEQYRAGRPVAGTLHLVGVGAGVVWAASAFVSSVSAVSDRDEAYRAYQSATDRNEAFRLWLEVETAHRRAESRRRTVGLALGAALAAHAAGIADAVIRHGSTPRLRVTDDGVALSVPIR